MLSKRLQGKIAVVTGSGSGIGQGCAPMFARPGARVVGGDIDAAAAQVAHPVVGALAHCAGKGGVLAMTRQLASEGGPHNIRANSISPAMIVTGADFRIDGGATAW